MSVSEKNTKKSDLKNVNEYFNKYIDKVKENDIIDALESSLQSFILFAEKIPVSKLEFRYSEGKWNIKEVLTHLIDSERILGYRALYIARNNDNLPGYDQDKYIKFSNPDRRTLEELRKDFIAARKSNIELYKSFDAEMLGRTATANNREVSVLTLGFVICGHVLHHLKVVEEKYL